MQRRALAWWLLARGLPGHRGSSCCVSLRRRAGVLPEGLRTAPTPARGLLSSSPGHRPEAPPPDTITLWGRVPHVNFGGHLAASGGVVETSRRGCPGPSTFSALSLSLLLLLPYILGCPLFCFHLWKRCVFISRHSCCYSTRGLRFVNTHEWFVCDMLCVCRDNCRGFTRGRSTPELLRQTEIKR